MGGFFALRTGTPGDGQVPLAGIYAGGIAPLTARVDKVGARLRAPERRIAASMAQLGFAARLWSIAVGCAVLGGAVPDLAPERLHWNPDATSPHDFLLAGLRWLPGTAESVRDVVQHGHLVPLAEALRRDGHVSPRLLWGNAGSALAGAVRELSGWAERHGRPEAAERAGALAAELFRHPDLSATGGTVAGAFRRRSCCLYYRCPAAGLCGDCVFDRAPQRSSVQGVSG
ncbi:(2Fe-2S)-binding protein [Streptomyces sp. NPDC006923]|uniref:(2Fe-2S)-binding protein n=1 Tax=Streptomyces sp. NPDC006923 TaxID=3155355 RepID=UPI0033E3CCC2